MGWIKSHTVLIRHRKLDEFGKSLRLKPVYAMGHLHALWHAAMEQQEDGDLSSWSDEFIATSSAYSGDAPQYVRLLQTHGWLDGKVLHDWLDYAGEYLTKKYKTTNRQRLVDIWRLHGKDYGLGSEEEAERKQKGSLDKIREDETRKPKTDAPAKPPAGVDSSKEKPEKPYEIKTPGQAVVAAYKLRTGVQLEDRAWDREYYPRFKKDAESLLRLCGGEDGATKCLLAVADWAEKKGLDWNLGTVVKRASDWKTGRLWK